MLNIDFKEISSFFTNNQLWDKPFKQFDKITISKFCETVFKSVDKKEGWEAPCIKNNNIVIPFNSPKKYRWWDGGQSLFDTLKEMGAPEEILEKYNHKKKWGIVHD